MLAFSNRIDGLGIYNSSGFNVLRHLLFYILWFAGFYVSYIDKGETLKANGFIVFLGVSLT